MVKKRCGKGNVVVNETSW